MYYITMFSVMIAAKTYTLRERERTARDGNWLKHVGRGYFAHNSLTEGLFILKMYVI